ncbi:hypothetical protein Cgig2_012900 [Carnegiea gigantea]|uniref:Uncharacterized protein n=1 Tax=Carnegiea gigantea TaxID=171969 RepID=A0A9Q1JJU8_9CARY|nr:hypothetical protein Cgig2_012900 [Carnegiea gigantea]
MKIFPRGKEFYPNHTHVIHALCNIMRSKFDSPYHTWKEIPIEVQNMWFDEFKKKFRWDDEHAHEIRRVFEFRGSSRLKGMTFEIRKKRKKLQREPTIDESFALTHSRKKYQSFVDQKSKEAYEKYKKILSEFQASTQGEGSTFQGTPLPQL